jgi:hypothetical protein
MYRFFVRIFRVFLWKMKRRYAVGQIIERDSQRFHKLVRVKVTSNLSKYISRGEMIGKRAKTSSRFRYHRSKSRNFASAIRGSAA